MFSILKTPLTPWRLHTWHQSSCWLTTSRCPLLPLATFSSEPLTKSMIPSLPRATANLILHATQEVTNKEHECCSTGNDYRLLLQQSRPSPARADVDVVGLVGHHGEFCHQLDHLVAVEHHIALRETQLDLEWPCGCTLVKSHDCCVLQLYLLLIVLTGHVQNKHPVAKGAHRDTCLKKSQVTLGHNEFISKVCQ